MSFSYILKKLANDLARQYFLIIALLTSSKLFVLFILLQGSFVGEYLQILIKN